MHAPQRRLEGLEPTVNQVAHGGQARVVSLPHVVHCATSYKTARPPAFPGGVLCFLNRSPPSSIASFSLRICRSINFTSSGSSSRWRGSCAGEPTWGACSNSAPPWLSESAWTAFNAVSVCGQTLRTTERACSALRDRRGGCWLRRSLQRA